MWTCAAGTSSQRPSMLNEIERRGRSVARTRARRDPVGERRREEEQRAVARRDPVLGALARRHRARGDKVARAGLGSRRRERREHAVAVHVVRVLESSPRVRRCPQLQPPAADERVGVGRPRERERVAQVRRRLRARLPRELAEGAELGEARRDERVGVVRQRRQALELRGVKLIVGGGRERVADAAAGALVLVRRARADSDSGTCERKNACRARAASAVVVALSSTPSARQSGVPKRTVCDEVLRRRIAASGCSGALWSSVAGQIEVDLEQERADEQRDGQDEH